MLISGIPPIALLLDPGETLLRFQTDRKGGRAQGIGESSEFCPLFYFFRIFFFLYFRHSRIFFFAAQINPRLVCVRRRKGKQPSANSQ
jgi:hypothetical protein